ncbi:Polyketide cyclase/dehydrase [Neofusicoccum parvum]|uniref:Putative cyclase dehydrase family protein n=1 Tax=Botryosphaeria parva (strain UCR-NP2) TaxID=1287680 RepID=R1END8_BOTPV|nr:putative cyclase dehydrase family protein [Neofusicoccum parvum UCRNP2]GME52191.1 Polyketide cyclase/dehydrase [Neofusicoccum parvum]
MKALRTAPARALLRPTPALRLTRPQTRAFLPNPFSVLGGGGGSSSSSSSSTTSPQHLSATRTLPYPSSAIYNIIADVSSYHTFLPYCQRSEVTAWSRPDAATGKRWPAEATLAVGWGGISEAFASRVYCVPGEIVEAVGGSSRTRLRPEQIAHHDVPAEPAAGGGQGEILTHLLTRWTVSPFPYQPPAAPTGAEQLGGAGRENPIDPQKPASGQPREQTQVSLVVEFAFANPLYGTMMTAVTPMVANLMIEAFEQRVEKLLDGPGLGGTKQKVPTEGVLNYSGPLKR